MLTAVILAAGRASRMGTLKQLLPWQGGRTILETVVQTVLSCPGLDDQVRVIVGAGSDKTGAVLRGIFDHRLRILENPDYHRGMLSSIQRGIADLPPASEGFLIFLGDQPLISPELVNLLIQHWLRVRPDFLVPVHAGRRGHPVFVSTKYTEEVAKMKDSEGGLRELLHRYPERVEILEVDNPAIHIDLDDPADYRKHRPGAVPAGTTVVIRGAGEMASAAAHRLYKVGFKIIMAELARPLAVRRTVSFAQAVFDGRCTVEGVPGQKAETLQEALAVSRAGKIAVYAKEIRAGDLLGLCPAALIDATLAKENLGTRIEEAPVVIGLGPGFTAGSDVHAVIETNRGHDLGRVLYSGCAQSNTGNPGDIGGYTVERVLKAPEDGIFSSDLLIGAPIAAGAVFGRVGSAEITAGLSGIVRGLLMPGTFVRAGAKLGDIDPRGERGYCFTISDKARAIAGGVLEALLALSGGI